MECKGQNFLLYSSIMTYVFSVPLLRTTFVLTVASPLTNMLWMHTPGQFLEYPIVAGSSIHSCQQSMTLMPERRQLSRMKRMVPSQCFQRTAAH